MSAVTVENLSYMYPASENLVLENVSLNIKNGELVLLTGRSGCGKTTLAWCLCGLIPHIFGGIFKGKVFINGKNTLKPPVYELAKEVGIVFQNPESQFCTLNVEEEVAFGPENLGLPRESIKQRVAQALDFVRMQQYRHRSLITLSYGQKQRVALASILSMLPKVIVLDEPTSNIDTKTTKEVANVLVKLKHEQGKTISVNRT